MKTALLLTVASLATVLGTKPATEEVKTDAAAGRYRGGNRGYSNQGYGNSGYGYPAYGAPGYWQPLVQDRFVCDLDASVLLVVDSHNRHHSKHRNGYGYSNPSVPANRAVRVKCSEVANHDEDSCNFCCQQTARRDTTLANDKLFGFLAITKIDDDETFKRDKRGADDDDSDDSDEDRRRHGGRRGGKYHKVDPTYVVEGDWKAPDYRTNVKCVCCAPRANANTAAQSPSTYSSPPVASNPSTGYNNGQSNTFNTQAVPVPAAAAAQPLVDSWQQPAQDQWSNTAASTVTQGGQWSAPAAAQGATVTQGQWNSAPAQTQGQWSSAPQAQAPSQGQWANTAAAPANNNWSTASQSAPAAPADNWGAASSDAAAPAPPPSATVTPIVTASNTY